jgi:hypothetical protein
MTKKYCITILILCSLFSCKDKISNSDNNGPMLYKDTLLASITGFEKMYVGQTMIDSGSLSNQALSYLDSMQVDTIILYDDTLMMSNCEGGVDFYYNVSTFSTMTDSLRLHFIGFYANDSLFLLDECAHPESCNTTIWGNRLNIKMSFYTYTIIQDNGSIRLEERNGGYGVLEEDSIVNQLNSNDTLTIWQYELDYR